MNQENMNKKTVKKPYFFWAVLVLSIVGGIFLLKEFTPAAKATKKLLQVAHYASVEEVTQLVREGADVNAVSKDRETPLMLAALQNSNPDVLRVLIDKGADVAMKNTNGKTALDYAGENEALKETHVYSLLREKTFSTRPFIKRLFG